jgi:prolyl oligopeptidase
LGTPSTEDPVVFTDPKNPEHHFGFEVSDDGKYFILTISESSDPKNKVYIATIDDILNGKQTFKKVVE